MAIGTEAVPASRRKRRATEVGGGEIGAKVENGKGKGMGKNERGGGVVTFRAWRKAEA